ncbi:MAG: beta-ketoacyl-[acyl-carrier-protein] synthase family protein [Planctomycetes bacterium]|nr:beta-ketoacyl-[acyl-carrier-protein] synthase family protein [Planctomycetota bacterium]
MDIAITGLGLTTSLGAGKAANWSALQRGESGIAPLKTIDTGDYPVKDGGEDPEPPEGPPFPDGEPAPPELRHLLGACLEAQRQAEGRGAGALAAAYGPEGVGLAVGSSLAASTASRRFFESLAERGPERADYGALKGYHAGLQLDYLLEHLGYGGPAVLVSNACAASASAIARAADWIRAGRARAAVAAGFDAFSIFTFAGFGSLQAMARGHCRPFSAEREGMKIGGGYAALALEPLEKARGRGMEPIALLSGYGESSDAHHLTHPHPAGLGAALAMRRALDLAGLEPADIDAINAHGTATRSNDAAEAQAMRAVFGERLRSIPIFALKPAIGHTLGGAGAVEAAVSILALQDQRLPPTLHAGEPDPEIGALDLVPAGRPARLRHVMSNAFGFGGSNASLIFSAAPEEARRRAP